MDKKTSIFEETYRTYLKQVADIDLQLLTKKLDIKVNEDNAYVTFFNQTYEVSSENIVDASGKQPSFDICIVLCKYILLCPDTTPLEKNWVSFKDFPDSGPLTVYFTNDVENPIVKQFTARTSALEKACFSLGGDVPPVAFPYDLAMQFFPLPKVPLLVLFNDADDEFPAHCSVLFEACAEKFLDAECLAILGAQLSHYLRNADG